MASSSSATYFLKPHKTNPLITNSTDEGEDHKAKAKAKEKAKAGEERDWLQLSLGRGFEYSPSKNNINHYSLNKSSSSSSSPFSFQQQLGLGLGLGCNGNISCRPFLSPDLPAPPSTELPPTISVPILPFCLRPPCGIWFTLRSSIVNNSSRESGGRKDTGLAQIPKMYIRVKDEKVTVLMVKSYLVTKLGLSNEAEIEIRCKGVGLSDSEMLKDVRDTIWLPRLFESSKSTPHNISVSDPPAVSLYLMSLDYQRNLCFSNF